MLEIILGALTGIVSAVGVVILIIAISLAVDLKIAAYINEGDNNDSAL